MSKKNFFNPVISSSNYTIINSTYTGRSKSIQTQNYISQDLLLKPDGSRIFWLGIIPWQLNMSVDFDISTAVYITSYNQRGQTGNGTPFSNTMAFNNDGTKLFIHSEINDGIYQYNLSTAYQLNTCSYSGNFISISPNLKKMLFNSDGAKMYLAYSSGIMYEYDLSVYYDITTWVYNGVNVTIEYCEGLHFSPDGLKLFLLAGPYVKEYDMTSFMDISTLTYNGNQYFLNEGDTRTSMAINNNFTKMYIGNSQSDYLIREYDINN